ncbi:MAG: DegV family EDD domain-containing protein [Clostridia bacterium]|nr:DegV family EDD domain-containing protein [Clostridia bacterium]
MGKRLVVGTSTGAIDFAPDRYKDLGIKIIPLCYTFKGVEYEENKVDAKSYYKELELINKVEDMPKTSMAKVKDIKDCFDTAIKDGYDEIIVITVSSYVSGTYNVICNVAKEYEDKLKITVIDSKIACFLEGYLCVLAQNLVNKGVSTEDIIKEINWVQKTQQFFGISSKLEFLIYGGRLKGAKAFMGKLLQICPMIGFDRDGVLGPLMSVRTPKKALHATCQRLLEIIGDRKSEDYILYHVHTGEHPVDMLKEIEKEYGIKCNHEDVIMTPVPASGSGPWLAGYGLSFIRREDEPLE